MVVRICDKGEQILYQREIVRLECADEDDAGLKLSFDAVYYDFLGRKYPLGPVKIGTRGMESGRTADLLPKEFRTVPKDFFSLGQDESYYENVSRLEAGTRKRLLEALREAVNEFDNYDQVYREFDGHLGNEAQLFLRTLLMLKGREVL